MANPCQSEVALLRQQIEQFIQDRCDRRLEKLKPEEAEKRQVLLQAYQREHWIEGAAKRVSQIQLVTHALKFTHPSARGSSIYLDTKGSVPDHRFAGTHSVPLACRSEDVVGNAAALDVYKFLKLDAAGESILQRVLRSDPALLAAMSDDFTAASHWCQSFAAITQSSSGPASHKLAKQLYFPTDQGEYHLLAPLFPTTLVHYLQNRLREDRFGEQAKAAREARKAGQPYPHGYCDYPGLTIRKIGGTKPQNISQLNSERNGENWLLASVPPLWRQQPLAPPLRTDSIFRCDFYRYADVSLRVRALGELHRKAGHNNRRVAQADAGLVARLVDLLLQYAAGIQQLEAGWSASEHCNLSEVERAWLDPFRARQDQRFGQWRSQHDWQSGVCDAFASWLNQQLRRDPMVQGQPENEAWSKVLQHELMLLKMELSHG
ncbi:type I-F CRISPR-associated protein Csy1 [Marinobacterium jannaschii]|uniref:type I-F CRISPR-associated protein Csy1 n=1 Tax=Marinobacterium jannaschii TaxID=64970 RepID=UPI00047FB668|nr:type I-F CRISPR-associated protein Csy1 [Marinobacterium jannaschii]